eukprot:874920-Pleurochrysis_carterae.AAC.4
MMMMIVHARLVRLLVAKRNARRAARIVPISTASDDVPAPRCRSECARGVDVSDAVRVVSDGVGDFERFGALRFEKRAERDGEGAAGAASAAASRLGREAAPVRVLVRACVGRCACACACVRARERVCECGSCWSRAAWSATVSSRRTSAAETPDASRSSTIAVVESAAGLSTPAQKPAWEEQEPARRNWHVGVRVRSKLRAYAFVGVGEGVRARACATMRGICALLHASLVGEWKSS